MIKLDVKKTIILIACLLITGLLIHFFPRSMAIKKPVLLKEALANLKGWERGEGFPLDERIVQELQLDDYLNQNYTSGNDTVYLYIGYYFNSSKVGAAHDPLVCFPGQGWALQEKGEGKFIARGTKDKKINYATMTIVKGQERQLVLYWFQSFDQTASNTMEQKIKSLWIKISEKRGDNAFVRITIPYGNYSKERLLAKAENFIEALYPPFLAYVRSQDKW